MEAAPHTSHVFASVCRCPVPGATRRVKVRTHNGLVPMPIDACIADVVEALGRSGIETSTSCCGHNGAAQGHILLADGRRLVIV